MQINITIEPEYSGTVWCKETMDGINEKVSSLRYSVNFCSDVSEAKDEIIIIGTSPDYVIKKIDEAAEKNILPIIVGCRPDETDSRASYVIINYDEATECALNYLHGTKPGKTALYGVKENSFSDIKKSHFFSPEDIYYFSGENAAKDCFDTFYEKINIYGSVLCVNYVSAVSLIKRLREKGLTTPKDIHIACFGDSAIGSLLGVSVITLDHNLLGRQAVTLYKYLSSVSDRVSICAFVSSRIVPGKTTENKNYTPSKSKKQNKNEIDIFSAVSELSEIQRLEKMLRKCDGTDFKIITMLQKNIRYADILDSLFISGGTLKYRIKKLLAASECENVKEMLHLFEEYRK